MKKFLVILTLVLLVSAFAVPAALAHSSGPVGNTTTVTAGGQHNNGVVVVNGKGNITTLNFASKTKWNVGVVGVVGCGNRTTVTFPSGAKYNVVGVVVNGACVYHRR